MRASAVMSDIHQALELQADRDRERPRMSAVAEPKPPW
jgi:hypothetical protein